MFSFEAKMSNQPRKKW